MKAVDSTFRNKSILQGSFIHGFTSGMAVDTSVSLATQQQGEQAVVWVDVVF